MDGSEFFERVFDGVEMRDCRRRKKARREGRGGKNGDEKDGDEKRDAAVCGGRREDKK